MSGVLARIRSVYESLPMAERKVADVILVDPEAAPGSSVHELAKKAEVSVASVSRFVRKVGYEHFRQFRLELARETPASVGALYEAITPQDSDSMIARKVFTGNIRGLEDTLKILDIPDFVRAARAISSCHRLVLFGMGGSGIVAHDAALRFAYLDFQAEAYVDSSQILLQAMRTRPEDVVVGISHSGRSSITIEGLRIARQSKALTVGVSNYLKSPLRDVSDLFFCTAFSESKVEVAAISSRVAQLCLLDALYLLVARHKKDLWDVEQVNQLTERMLRVPVRGSRGGGGRRGGRRRREERRE